MPPNETNENRPAVENLRRKKYEKELARLKGELVGGGRSLGIPVFVSRSG
jgi:hypothetical protein